MTIKEQMEMEKLGFLSSAAVCVLVAACFVGWGLTSCSAKNKHPKYSNGMKQTNMASVTPVTSAPASTTASDKRCVDNPYAQPAAASYGVPVELLQCIHYVETRCSTGGENSGGFLAYTRLSYKNKKARQGNKAALANIAKEIGIPYHQIRSNPAMAMGPFQYVPITWWGSGLDADHDGMRNPFSLADSTYTTAKRLRNVKDKHGTWGRAVYSHNHSRTYVQNILSCAGL